MRGETIFEWCTKNGEYGKKLLEEFGDGRNSQSYFDDEKKSVVTPHDIARGSHRQVKWTCMNCGHVFFSKPNTRTAPGRGGCPECAGNRCIKGKNDLHTWCMQNSERGKQLLSEFGEGKNTQVYLEENNIKKPSDYSKASHSKIKWTCKNGHSWEAVIKNRVLANTNCPICNPSNITVPGRNDLFTWCINNGEYGLMLIEELDSKIDPHSIANKSSKKVDWKCKKGHVWRAAPADRTNRKSYCPRCSGHSTSYPEQFLYYALKQLFPETENRFSAFRSKDNPRGIEYDIAILRQIRDYNSLYIEYSPTGWHKGKEEKDKLKRQLCEDNNIGFISVVEDTYKEYEECWAAPNIVAHLVKGQIDNYIEQILVSILSFIGHSIDEVDIESARIQAKRSTRGMVDIKKSLLYNYPDLCLEWDKCNAYSPEEVTCGSNKLVSWKCTNCNNIWYASIYNRTKGYGCPKCHYSWKTKKIERSSKFVSMASKYPKIQDEIDKRKSSNIDLNNIASADDKTKAWWICAQCGASYYQYIRSRALGYCGCPICKRKRKDTKEILDG